MDNDGTVNDKEKYILNTVKKSWNNIYRKYLSKYLFLEINYYFRNKEKKTDKKVRIRIKNKFDIYKLINAINNLIY